MIHADNLMEESLQRLLDAHKNRESQICLTMLTFMTDEPWSCGIIETDSDGRVKKIHEKTKNPPGFTANGAVFVFSHELLPRMKEMEKKPYDFCKDVVTEMVDKVSTVMTEGIFIDIGTKKNLDKALRAWEGF